MENFKNILIVNTDAAADFFNVSIRTVQSWGRIGCPKVGQGKWNLKDVFSWWFKNIAQDRIEAGSDGAEMQAVKLRYWTEKANFEEIRNKKELEELMPKAEIADAWAWRVSEVKHGLMGLAYRLPPLISGKAEREVRDIVKLNVRQLLDNFSRGGKFCHPDDETKGKKI